MTKGKQWLADVAVRAAVRSGKPRWLHDGKGLYVHIVSKTSASWVYRYQLNGRTRYAGLGAESERTLAKARAEHARLQALKRDGIDPVQRLHEERAERARIQKEKELAATPKLTVRDAADAFRAAKSPSWSKGWTDRFDTIVKLHIVPSLGDRPVAAVVTADVEQTLRKIWETQTPTAKHTRIILEQIFAFATSKEWRSGSILPHGATTSRIYCRCQAAFTT